MSRRIVTVLFFSGALVAVAGCRSGAPAVPPPVAPPAPPPPATEPPPLQVQDVAAAKQQASAAEQEFRRSIVDAVWKTVRDKHYDPKLGGIDWNAARARHEPLILAAPDRPSFYRAVNDMLGELGQSHLAVSGPGDDEGLDDAPPAPDGELGDPGVVIRIIEDRPVVWNVRPGSSAARAGIVPGMIVTQIGGREIGVHRHNSRPLRPVEQRFELRLHAQSRLGGPAGSRVTMKVVDLDGKPREVMLERDRPAAKGVRFGYLPPLYPEVKVSNVGEVGVIRFNFFLLEPVLGEVTRALDAFRASGAKGVILDLRGNPGGQAEVAIPLVARLQAVPLTLGTVRFRDFNHTLSVTPDPSHRAFTGPVVILTDEGTASASEILAAGLQEAGRAQVVGDTTVGMALPSMVEALPGGAVLQVVIADFRTPGGVAIEGRGVQPDRRVVETLASVRAGKDLVLEAGVDTVRALARSGLRPGERKPANADARPAPAPAGAPPVAAPARPGRPAAEVAADHARATGGVKAWSSHRTLHVRSTLDFNGVGIQGTEEEWLTSSGIGLRVTSVPLVAGGAAREGCDQRVCWSDDALNGLRILGGTEAAQSRLGFAWAPMLHLRELFKTAASEVERGGDGVEYECLHLEPRGGGPDVVNCYHPATHLLSSTRVVQASPQGEIPVRTEFSDWREVQGVMLPHAAHSSAGPVSWDSRVVEAAFDVKVDPKTFSPPKKK